MVCNEDINDFSNSVCECNVSYVLTSKSECSECPENCRQCRYQNPKKICYQCEPGYYLDTNNECISCGDNCKYCELERNKNIICRQCFEGFNLNDNKNCLSCPENCESCKIESNKIICTKCKEKYGVNGNGLCETCPDNCLECFWKIPVNEFGCSKCESDTSYPFENNYIIGKNDKCVKCQDIDDIGGKGCIECLYDKISYKYKCSRCLGDTRGLLECSFCPIPKGYYDPIKDYAFITNEYKCLLNTQLYPEYLHGCLEAMHNTTSKIYECNICKPEFIPVIDEKSCRTPEESDLTSDCIRAKILNIPDIKIYTCLQCKFTLENYNFHDYLGVIYFKDRIEILTSYLEYWNVKVVNHLGKMNCLRQNDEIQNCLEAKEDENGIRICTKCIYNYPFIYDPIYQHNVCDNKCADYSFQKYKWCYFCDDKYYGNKGCIKESGCLYNNANDELVCVECQKGYFKMSGQCLFVKVRLKNVLNVHIKKMMHSVKNVMKDLSQIMKLESVNYLQKKRLSLKSKL